MSQVLLTDLQSGDTFIGPDRASYQVQIPTAEHPRGWVEVRNLSMTDDEAARMLATPGAVEPGSDPREGTYFYSHPVYVDVVSDDRAAADLDDSAALNGGDGRNIRQPGTDDHDADEM